MTQVTQQCQRHRHPFSIVEKYIYFRKLRKFRLQTVGRCEISIQDKFPSYFLQRTNKLSPTSS